MLAVKGSMIKVMGGSRGDSSSRWLNATRESWIRGKS
jgi:hypothetical protein